MKKTSLILATGVLALSLLAGCGPKADDPALSPSPEITPPVNDPATPPVTDPKAADLKMLEKLAGLLGVADDKVVEALGEGTANLLEGTENLLSREYTEKIFDEDAAHTVAYDDAGMVSSISIVVSGTEIDTYTTRMTAALGEYSSTAGDDKLEEGSGSKSFIWNTDTAIITLVQAYGTISIDITALS